MSDPRLEQARAWLAGHSQPVSHLRPSKLMTELEAARRHLAAVLTAASAGLDSELWQCAGCGSQLVGHRPADDRCRDCTAARPVADRPMDTDDIDPETGETWGVDPVHDPLAEAG